MSKKELVPNRQYADGFKVEAVRLGESIGANKAAYWRRKPPAGLIM